MSFLDKDDIETAYDDAKSEATQWQKSYPAFERLADNDLMDGLDTNLPEVNDGSLAAALFKLPKRIVSSKLTGTVKAIDRDEAWLSEFANLQWQNEIIPNANSQAPFHRKWKDAVRKAAIYGSVPLITLFVEKNGKRTTDFIVAQPQDVRLEAGKVSDYDSDVIFWDVYYSKLQVENMIEQAKKETKTSGEDGYNKWDIPALEKILKAKSDSQRDVENRRSGDDAPKPSSGFKFCVAVQRGVSAPFYMYHAGSKATVREWTNPDPTGDIPIHYLYCYQDFKNPYGVGIVKLAGGTQNVLDYMRQADVLATQLGLRPPIAIEGNEDQVDIDSIVYSQDALWFTGGAKVVRQELGNGVYSELPNRMSMYKTSLNQLIPTGDTSIASDAGDPQYSKTPAGVKFQQASLSIDDEDFKDNLYVTYEAKARSMINTHFANMEGTDLMKLGDDERELLIKGGLEFPQGEDGEMSNQLEIQWDTVRASFNFEVDPEANKAKADAEKLEGLMKVLELKASDPNLSADLAESGKKLNSGELLADIIRLTSDNDKIVVDVQPDEQQIGADGQPIPPAQLAAQKAQEQQQALEEAQKEIEDLKNKLAEEQQVPYAQAPEDIKRQKEERAGYQPSQMQTTMQTTTDQNEAKLELQAQKQHHDQHMDLIREATAPDPMVMAQMKQKSDEKKKPVGVK